MNITIKLADYHNPQDAAHLIALLDGYASDPMGGGQGLTDYVKQNLVATLAQRSGVFTLLAYVDDQPAGIVNCVEGFSTFKCKPLLNIHDIAVLPEFRGLGLSLKMMAQVEHIGREKGCCKITLEVLEGNVPAKNAYIKFGFAGYELDPAMGKATFWQKEL